MILPEATLFPQALLPLYIFEPRYRQMLADVLATHRMFVVVMQRLYTTREMPLPVGGLGLVRAAVTHSDGTSHLILQGLTRVRIGETVRYKPYRIQRIEPFPSEPAPDEVLQPLLQQVQHLVRKQIQTNLALNGTPIWSSDGESCPLGPCSEVTARQLLEFISRLHDPECVADLIGATLVRDPCMRQVLLGTANVAQRLELLVGILREQLARSPGKKG